MKGCPFCGKDDYTGVITEDNFWYFAYCGHCECSGPREISREKAISSWDKRFVEVPAAEELEALRLRNFEQAQSICKEFDEGIREYYREKGHTSFLEGGPILTNGESN